MIGELLLAIVVTAYLCGRRAGLVSTAIVVAASYLLFDGPLVRVALLGVNGCIISALSGKLHVARRRAEASRAEFAKLFEASPLPSVLVRSSDQVIVAVNDAFIACFGWRRDELVGRQTAAFELYPVADERKRLLAQWNATRSVRNFEIEGRRKTQELRRLLVSIDGIELGGVAHSLTIINDITEQRASEARFARAFDASPTTQVMVRAADRTFVAVNEAFVRTSGYSRDEVIGKNAADVPFFVDNAARDHMLETLAAKGEELDQELQLLTKSGAILDVVWSVVVVDFAGQPTVLMVAHDITDRKRAERALRASEERFAKAFQENPLPATIVRVGDHKFVACNEAFVRLFGYSREELLACTSDGINLYAERSHGSFVQAKLAAQGKLKDEEVRFITKQGTPIDVLWSIEFVDLGGEPSMLCVYQDISERKRAEAALLASESRFRDLANNIGEVFWVSGGEPRRLEYISPAYEAIFGRSIAELHANPNAWVEAIHLEDRTRVAEVSTLQSVTGEYEQEYRIIRPDGTVRWIRDRAFPVRDDNGRVSKLVGVAEDVTERHQLEEQLRQAQKIESLGLLAGGVAHDFNNILAVISSCSGMLGDTLPRTGEERELIDDIDAAVSRAVDLTRQLLAFSRKQVIEPQVLDLNKVVNETHKMLRRMVGEDILLSTSFEPELGQVRVDPGYLVQVLMNLAVNARDAMPQGGTLELTTRNVTITEEQVRRHRVAKPGPAVVLAVTDSGSGMSDEIKARIFEPFFTTKEVGKGTGMGLAVVHGIVEQAGGFLEVDSTPGVGSTFRIYLPVVDGASDTTRAMSGRMAFGAETVLLVDDDGYVRRSTARALRSRGYTVIEASSGAAALELLAGCSGLDLLLTDVVMPGMDGRQLAEAATMRFPGLKVLYTSGYTDDAVVRHGVDQGAVNLIEKPFRIDTLAMKVRQVLDREPADSAGSSVKTAGRRREGSIHPY